MEHLSELIHNLGVLELDEMELFLIGATDEQVHERDELSELQLVFPWMFKQYVDERAELQRLFPWLSGPSP